MSIGPSGGAIRNGRLLCGVLGALSAMFAGCAGEHGLVASSTGDLACEASELRSAWWSDGGGPFYGGTGEIVLNAAGTHLLVQDLFRSTALRLSDGARSEGGRLTVDLTEVSGIRFAVPRMMTDAEGRNDYAGATDLFAIGTPTPLATVPWIVPRDSTGYTQVVGHVSQTTDRAFLIERATHFGGEDRGTWLRSIRVSSPSEEIRVDLAAALPPSAASFEAPFSILADDESSDVVLLAIGRQVETPAGVARVDLRTGTVTAIELVVGAAAPVLGIAHVGEPGAQLLDIALSSDGTELYVTTRDGQLRVLDAETLEESRSRTSVGIVIANADTYLPSVRSPVASSASDELLAMLDAEGQVVIVDGASMRPIATLRSAAPLVRDIDLDVERAPRAMALRFLPDGLVLITDTGVERFRCPG